MTLPGYSLRSFEVIFQAKFGNLKKISNASDYCDSCHNIKKEMYLATTQHEYDELKNWLL